MNNDEKRLVSLKVIDIEGYQYVQFLHMSKSEQEVNYINVCYVL